MSNPNGEKCETCQYFRDNECHRQPPNGNGWSSVLTTDWCGEWSPIEEESPA